MAQEERAIAEVELEDAIRSLTLDIRQAFIDLQLAQENLALARENAAALDEIVTLNQTRVRGGDLAEVELLRSRVAALQSRQAVRSAELKVLSERRRLERTIGRQPGSLPFEIQPLTKPEGIAESETELHTRALRARPDLRALQLTQARSQAEARRQLRWGRLTGPSAPNFAGRKGVAGHGNSLGLFMSTPLPLFDRNQGNIARVREEGRQVDAKVTQLEHAIAADVDVATAQYKTAGRDPASH